MYRSLTSQQKEIVFHRKRKRVVRACPGSGKTYAVAAKLAYRISEWTNKHTGIATLSFTNVAWQEISEKLSTTFCTLTPLRYPHFLGTIDSFINNYIFLPHGHLVMQCARRPRLVGEPHGSWHAKFYSEQQFDKITYDINGQICLAGPMNLRKGWKNNKHIIGAKEKLNKCGFATQADANYYSMRIVKDYPSIAKALVYRFPTIIIDEAQDSSDIQMRIIDLLIKHGLKEILIVGDPDQAIYEWNKAKPSLLIKKFKEWRASSVYLNENRRSSQNICDFSYHLSTLRFKSKAIDPDVKRHSHIPQIMGYKECDIKSLIDNFLKLCISHGLKIDKKVTILVRSRPLASTLRGDKNISKIPTDTWDNDSYTKGICRGKLLIDRQQILQGYRLMEKGFYKALYKKDACTKADIDILCNAIGFEKWRQLVHDFIKCLPITSMKLKDWIAECNKNLRVNNGYSSIELNIKSDKCADEQIDTLFGTEKDEHSLLPYRIETIHGVKGETVNAALVILKSRGHGKAYKTLLKGNTQVDQSEELRIVYVGITRPKKILVLAVPETDKDAWCQRVKPEIGVNRIGEKTGNLKKEFQTTRI